MTRRSVGVAPGTLTLHLGRQVNTRYNPYTDMIQLSNLRDENLVLPAATRLDRPLRWDLIGIVGGGSLLVALAAGLIASAISIPKQR